MSIAKNSLWLLLARIGTQGMAALFTILLARRLGSASFGEYAVIAAVLFVGNMLTTFGTDMSLIREIAMHNDLSLLAAALFIQLALSFLFIIVIWFGVSLLPNYSSDRIVAMRIYSFALIPLAFFTVFTSALRGLQLMDAYTWLNLTGSLLQLALIWFFIKSGAGIVNLVSILFVSQVLVALIGAAICHYQIQGFWRGWRFEIKDISVLLKASAPLALLTGIAMIYQKLSIMFVFIFGGPAMTGWFASAQRTMEAAKTGHAAVFTALYPAMAQSKDKNFHGEWILLLAGALVGATTLSALAMPVTRILFGVEYEAAVPSLQILAWMLIPYTVNTFLVLRFIAFNRERPVLNASALSLVVLAIFSLWWIPRVGLSGACFAALLAESVQAIFLLLQWRVG